MLKKCKKNVNKMKKKVKIPQKIQNLEIFRTDGPTDRPTDQRVESRARD